MRIVRLDLLAFGPFTDRTLDFSPERDHLQVVFGANEAGKSTTLRALEGLLFGIGQRTGDAHLHAYERLRIGGLLEGTGGDTLEIVRRKGRVATLRDARGEPVDEVLLRRLLHGVDADTWKALYGLDHESLRLGAEALERAQGKVGESLFDAGLGGLGVAKVIADLTEEAEALYTPLGRKKPVKEALSLYAEATREGMQATDAKAFHVQEQGIEEARREAREAEAERKELSLEQARLVRLSRALPHLAKLRQLRDERDLLGEVIVLPDEAAAEREAATKELAAALSGVERLEAEVSKLTQDGSHPELLADAERCLAELAPHLRGTDARAAGGVAARASRIALHREQISAKRHADDSRRAELDARKMALERALAALGPTADASMLSGALEAASPAGDIEAQIARSRADAESLRARAKAELAALGLFTGSLEDLAKAPVPAIEAFEQAFRASAERSRVLEAELAAAMKSGREKERDLGSLLRGGSLVSEADLDAERRARDEAFARIGAGKAPPREALDDLRRRIDAADGVADRLRRETARVERHAQLTSARDEVEVELARIRGELAALASEAASTRAAWTEAWKGSGVDPIDPADMRTWLGRRRAIVEVWVASEAAARSARELEVQAEALADELARATSAVRSPSDDEGAASGVPRLRLAALVATARTLLAELDRTRGERGRLLSEVADVDAESARRGAEAIALAREDESTRQAWEALATGVGLGASASLDEVLARAVHIGDAARVLENAERDRRALAKATAALAEERARAERADTTLEALAAAAGVPRASLPAAEARSRQAAHLDRLVGETKQTLLAVSEGATIADLEAERAAFRDVELGVALDELAEKILAAAEARRDRAHADAGGLAMGLKALQGDASGEEHALDAESHLATAATLFRRHAVARIAKEVLEREVERYRASHQAPIVERAGELLEKLTLGRYERLTVVYGEGDTPELRCVRGDHEVGVDGLSDGARDQLYLALRLATLERHTALGEPMPLVLDDIFVHFDDERTRAGLEVLADLAKRVQVILFTHHARVVEMARAISAGATIHAL